MFKKRLSEVPKYTEMQHEVMMPFKHKNDAT